MTGQHATWTPYLDDGRTLDHSRAVDLTDHLVGGTFSIGPRRASRTGSQFSADEARRQYEQGVVFPQPELPVTIDSMLPFVAIWQEVDRPRYRDGHRIIDGEVAEPGVVQSSRSEPFDGQFVL
jgi:hypothetical protein